MELYSGMPYWIVKNPLWNYFKPLKKEIKTRVAVIGSGITGALVAHELCRAGVECCVIDKRSLSTGSSSASTALLQYEIDVPLTKLIGIIPPDDAVAAYRYCLRAIDDLEKILKEAKVDATFERVPSIYYASNRRGFKMLKSEFAVRRYYDLPVELLSKKTLYQKMKIKAPGALMNNASAQVDAYAAATGLLRYNMKNHKLKVYTHTEVVDWKRKSDGYFLQTDTGGTVNCEYVVVATGFESAPFLPEKLMQLTSTFAIISEPVEKKYLWPDKSLIWETKEPYLYIRTDDSNRIIVGGEDININSAAARKFLLDKKAATLEKKFLKLFPQIPFKTEMAWAGTFSSTKDGLPLIGATSENPYMLYALGYGGNGITFSVIAAQMISKIVQGEKDCDSHIFSLDRLSLQ